MDKWHVVHDYRRLADRGNVPWLICKYCREGLKISIAENGNDPAFNCWTCGVRIYPGDYVFEQLKQMTDDPSTVVQIKL